jgi:Uma2 family endonuclease
MGDPERAPGERFTYGQYATWPDEERWELIDGQAWAMSPAPLTSHQEISARLFNQIYNFLRDKPCRAFAAPFDVLLPQGQESDEETDTVVQPDISVFCDRAKISRRGARGAPDWVIEILSARTAKKDFEAKFHLYQRHGVREYWIVDPDSAAIHAWLLGADGAFGVETIYEDGATAPSSVLSGLVIDTRPLFADLD